MASRPWKVFVQEIGPMFSFASPDNARKRARELTDGTIDTYGRVEVWCTDPSQADVLERWHYEYNKEPVHQMFVTEPEVAWVAV